MDKNATKKGVMVYSKILQFGLLQWF